MTNLRGGTFEKQQKNAFHKMLKFGTPRAGCSDHGTHSIAQAKKRTTLLNAIVEYLHSINAVGKINIHLGNYELMNDFFSLRLSNSAKVPAKKYLSEWSSMIKSLIEENVTISDTIFDVIAYHKSLAELKENPETRLNRAINKDIIKHLYEYSFEAGVIAETQYKLGYRTAEAYELVSNPDKYIVNGKVQGLKGKGNHIYISKSIEKDLIANIYAGMKFPTSGMYRKFIKKITENKDAIPHDFRYTYALNEFTKRMEDGMPEIDALREVSILLNHHRVEVTRKYLMKA